MKELNVSIERNGTRTPVGRLLCDDSRNACLPQKVFALQCHFLLPLAQQEQSKNYTL